jgi:hypothetical protein
MGFFEEFEARIARSRAEKRLARVVLLRALAGREVPFYAPCAAPYANMAVVVHRDTYAEHVGQWRVTRFEGEEPIGHVTSRSFMMALHEAQEWRAVLPLARALSTL